MENGLTLRNIVSEWCRVSPQRRAWFETRMAGAMGGMIVFPFRMEDIEEVLASLRSLPDGVGELTVEEVIAPWWNPDYHGPFEEDV